MAWMQRKKEKSLCQPMLEKVIEMPSCELLSVCPFFSDNKQEMSEMTEMLKEDYCKGNYAWCGRYIAFKALEREMKIVKSNVSLAYLSKGDE